MVDIERIENLLQSHFTITGTYNIVRGTGIINVKGDVRLKEVVEEIPVQFGKVTGDFECMDNELTTLKGAPYQVGGSFTCYLNDLEDLTHAPQHVGGDFDCSHNPLTSLNGAPEHVGDTLTIPYQSDLPLLRSCMYKKILIGGDVPDPVDQILQKYAGSGRPGALLAAAELIRAGYRENARW